jgi:glutathione S-transferase
LFYKQVPFQENLIYSGGDEWLAIRPEGKVPAITTADGRHLSESSVICDFIEEIFTAKPPYPSDPTHSVHLLNFAGAKNVRY